MPIAAHSHIDAAGYHALLGLAAALCVEELEHEPVLLEDAGLLTELRRRRLPGAALGNSNLYHVLRRRIRGQGQEYDDAGDAAA
jgi:hypothetical protein